MRDVFKLGVFRIVCVPTNKALFVTSINVWQHAHPYFIDLEKGEADFTQMVEDYKQYGNDNFDVKLVAYGDEYWDPINVKRALDDAKNAWQGDLYE